MRYRQPDRARERRNLVLKVLAEQGVVKPEEAERAMKAPLGITDNAGRAANYFPAFLDLVRTPATLARIEHMLETGKPLRN